MSFDITCPGCGALSGPYVGVCPFCKTVMTTEQSKNAQQTSSLLELCESGRTDMALVVAKKMYTSDEKYKKDLNFLLTYVKILIDIEAPSSQVNGLLAEAHMIDPKNQEVLDYIELMQAKTNLKRGIHDSGEMQLKSLLRRVPHNPHALFILGSHLFWQESQPTMAIYYLENCVKLAPSNVRAWGCLGMIYQKMNNPQLAQRAFNKCLELEKSPSMRTYFQQELNKVSKLV